MARLRPLRPVAALVAASIVSWAPATQAAGVHRSVHAVAPGTDADSADSTQAAAPDEAPASETAADPVPDRGAVLVEIDSPPLPPEPEPAPPPVVEPLPVDPDRPEEPRFGGRPATGKGLMIAGGSVFAVGAAALVTSSLITLNCSYEGPLRCRYEDQAEFLIPLSATPAVLGLVLLGVGAGYHARYKRWENWTPDTDRVQAVLTPAVNRDGAGFALTGRF